MENVQTNEQREAAEVDRLKWIHSSEVEQLQLRIKDLIAENKLLSDELEANSSLLKAQISAANLNIESKSKVISEKNAIISQMSEQLTKARDYLAAKSPVSLPTPIYGLLLIITVNNDGLF